MNKTVSIIVPTHNRCSSLKRLLDNLDIQTYPSTLLEAIIVADACSDNTINFLQQYTPSYKLKWTQLTGVGAATARNKGAAMATGEILLFLDDDIEPSVGLVEAHVKDHKNVNTVVVGYLPITIPKKATFHQINLTSWWELKYFKMRNKYYRYSYEDLLSGNFSISTKLFDEVKGFDTSFKCREDYELGTRLIKSGADFIFSHQAWGYHRDESTDFPRLLRRRRDEGRADVRFARKHPDLLKRLRLYQYYGNLSRNRKILFYSAFNLAFAGDHICNFLLGFLNLYEKIKYRQTWHLLNASLNDYWYIRGLADELETQNEFFSLIEEIKAKSVKEPFDLHLDLKFGVVEAEKQIDLYRPGKLHLCFGNHFIGEVEYVPGMEKLRGKHLKSMLVTEFADAFTHALMVEEVIKQPSITLESNISSDAGKNCNDNYGN